MKNSYYFPGTIRTPEFRGFIMLKWNFRSLVSCRLSEFILLLVVIAVSTPPAFCRDELRRVYPDEITVDGIERFGRWLNLSESQQVAVRAMHKVYLQKFATLKTEVIDPLGPPEWKDENSYAEHFKLLDTYWDETKIIRNKIRRVDGELFGEIGGILDDSQFAGMQRVRDHRALQTLRVATFIRSTHRPPHDLTKFAYDLELSEADAALLDPILQSYVRRLLILSRPLHDIAFRMATEPYREIVRRGFGDEKLIDSSVPWNATNREVWRDQGRRINQLINDIDELNETTTRRIEQTFSYEGVQAWLDEYMTRCYQIASWPRTKRKIILKAIDQAGPLHARDDSIFQEQLRAFDTSLRHFERGMIELDLKYLPRGHFSLRENGATWPNREYQEDVDEALKDLDTLVDTFLLQLEQTLSPGGFARWDAAYVIETKRKTTRPTHTDGKVVHRINRASIFLESRDIERINRIFSLDEEQRAILKDAFQAYGKRKTALEADLPEGFWNTYGMEPPQSGNLRDRLRQIDELIFSALARQFEDESDVRKLNWLRNARQRIRLGREGSPRGAGGAGGVDIVLFILDSELEVEEIETLAPLIEEYDTKAAGVYELLFEAYTTNYDWYFENQDNRHFSPHYDAYTQSQVAVAHLNADTMFAIGEQLDSEAGIAMIELFTRFCYYPVFDDPERAQTILNRTSRIEDLSASQRDALLDLKVLYLEEYERLTAVMLEDAKYTLYWASSSLTDRRLIPSYESDELEAYQRHRFLRDELNASTIVKLRTILNPEQVEAMGGLPKK